MRVLVFALVVVAAVLWSWAATRLFWHAASHIRSRVAVVPMMLLYGFIAFVPLVAVGWAATSAFGVLTRPLQLAAILLGGVPALLFAMHHSHLWKRPLDHRSREV